MSGTDVEVVIEGLVIEGWTRRDASRIVDAMVDELDRRLASDGLADAEPRHRVVLAIEADPVRHTPHSTIQSIGTDLATSILRSMRG